MLGATRAEIAENLLGVARSGVTEAIWTAAQTDEVSSVLQAAAERCGAAVHRAADVAWAVAATRHVAGLGAANAALGAAAGAWLAGCDGRVADHDSIALGDVALPGRLSVHAPTSTRRGLWVVDAAISAEASGRPRAGSRAPAGARPRARLVSRRQGCRGVLRCARLDELRRRHRRGDLSRLHGAGRLGLETRSRVWPLADETPGVVLCLGTISFVGEVLEHLDASTDRFW